MFSTSEKTQYNKNMEQSQDHDGMQKYSPNKDKIFRKEAAKGVLSYLIRNDGNYTANEYSKTKGYYFDDKSGKYVAFDNSTNECFVEEFNTESRAIGWLNGEFNVHSQIRK